MPKIKPVINKAAKNSFLPYDGPALVPGSYDAEMRNPAIRRSQAGNLYINAVFEVSEPKKSDKAKFNGAAIWGRVMFQSENENQQARFNSFLTALGVPLDKADINHKSDEDLDEKSGSAILSIGGKKIDGRKVRITLTPDNSSDQANALQVDLVAPVKGVENTGPAEEDAEDDEDLEVEAEDVEVEDGEDTEDDDEDAQAEMDERTKELKKTPLAELKEAAKEAGIDVKGLKKADLVEAIVEWEFSDEDDEAAEDDEDLEDEELEEAEDEEDEEDEEVEDEEDEDLEAALREELSSFNRVELKKRIKGVDEDFKVFKSTTDDALRDAIVAAELNTPPF